MSMMKRKCLIERKCPESLLNSEDGVDVNWEEVDRVSLKLRGIEESES